MTAKFRHSLKTFIDHEMRSEHCRVSDNSIPHIAELALTVRVNLLDHHRWEVDFMLFLWGYRHASANQISRYFPFNDIRRFHGIFGNHDVTLSISGYYIEELSAFMKGGLS